MGTVRIMAILGILAALADYARSDLTKTCSAHEISFASNKNGICGHHLADTVDFVCSMNGKRKKRSTSVHESANGIPRETKANALSFLSKRSMRQGIICECCRHQCTILEMFEYCNGDGLAKFMKKSLPPWSTSTKEETQQQHTSHKRKMEELARFKLELSLEKALKESQDSLDIPSTTVASSETSTVINDQMNLRKSHPSNYPSFLQALLDVSTVKTTQPPIATTKENNHDLSEKTSESRTLVHALADTVKDDLPEERPSERYFLPDKSSRVKSH